jgi:hypothetical protein
LVVIAALLAAGLVAVAAAPAAAPGRAPAVAFADNGRVVVARADGTPLRTFPDFGFYSLDGNVFAGSRWLPDAGTDELIGYDAASGKRLFRIRNAFGPIVLDRGRKVAFLPDRDGQRDPQVNSVWIRDNRTGTVRKIVQFSNGGDLPGIPTGLDGEGVPLSVVFDRSGRTMALAEGNDVDLFVYVVWLVDVKTGQARRMTDGTKSRWPALSPDGGRLAVVREHALCAGGLRAGDVELMQTRGPRRTTTLLPGSCSRSYSARGWASPRRLLAFRFLRVGSGEWPYRVDLVSIDVRSGKVNVLVGTGDVAFFSVSPSRHVLAYARDSQPGFYLRDLKTGCTTHVAQGFAPHLGGDHVWY